MKNLILTDPHRIKCTAESIPVKFHVPVGCQLITIYIPQNEYDELVKNSERIQTMCVNQENVNANGVANGSIVNGINAYPPIQFKKKIMKRDKSLVFTNIPEEHFEQSDVGATTSSAIPVSTEATDQMDEKLTSEQRNNENPLKFIPQPATARPNHLPLRFKNITSKDIPESGFSSSITFDEQDSFPQFIGRTSVCSTPMTENKVLHGNIMPICGNPYNEKNTTASAASDAASTTTTATTKNNNSATSEVSVQQPIITNNQVSPLREHKQTNCQTADIDRKDENGKFFDLSDRIVNRSVSTQQPCRRNSLIDIAEAFRKFSKHLSLRPISNGFTNFMHECDYIADGKMYPYGKLANDPTADDSVIDFDADEIDDVVANNRYRTIADPTYPVFNSFGKPISQYLYDEIMNQQNQLDTNAKRCQKSHFSAFDELPALQTIHNDLKSADADAKVEKAIKSLEKPQLAQPNNNINRKSLSLPLKSLTSASDAKNNNANINTAATTSAAAAAAAAAIPTDIVNTKNIFDRPDERRKLNGIQLTPLITKLSILAMSEERSNAFSSWDIPTPGIESATPLDNVKMFRRKSSIKADETDQVQNSSQHSNKTSSECSDDLELRKVELFICGQNNMTMLLIMSENHSQKQEHVQAMVCIAFDSNRIRFSKNSFFFSLFQFDVCVSKLPRLESNLNQILNINMNGDKTDGGYSFFCVDPEWDTMQRGGPWSNIDLNSIEYVRSDLQSNPKMHNMTIR